MEAKNIALISVLSALCVSVGLGRGTFISGLPGVVEFMTVIIFVSGFTFGWLVGAVNGAISLTLYMIMPSPFAHPAAWIFVISPVLLVVMAGLGSMYGIVGGLLGRRVFSTKIGKRFIFEMAIFGFLLTFVYDVMASIGFYLAYPAFQTFWEALYLTFVPLYMWYPPIVHTFTNTIVFAILAPILIKAIETFKTQKPVSENTSKDPGSSTI